MYLIIILLFTSCSFIRISGNSSQEIAAIKSYERISNRDYLRHIQKFSDSFIKSGRVTLYRLAPDQEEYINHFSQKIIRRNELFFKDLKRVKIYIIKDTRSYHFSLPSDKIFLSSGLISRYIKNENLFASVVSYELIRIAKNLYKKNEIIPTGEMTFQKFISLLRIDVDTRVEIHKWAYHIMNRAGFEGDTYLRWIQTQNRNALDFLISLGKLNTISKEEHEFKKFLIGRRESKNSYKSKSSFYLFLDKIRKLHEK